MRRFLGIVVILLTLLMAGCTSMGMTEQWPWLYEDSPYNPQTGSIER